MFTDVCLPGGRSGPQLASVVRSPHPELPVLFSSGYAAESMLANGRLALGVELLEKPHAIDDLARRRFEALG